MDVQTNPTSPDMNQPLKSGSDSWLWIAIALGILIICVLLIALVLVTNPNLLDKLASRGSRVNVTEGTYEGTVYTAPNKNFTCDFGTLMSGDFNPKLEDGQHVEDKTGIVLITDDAGNVSGINYLSMAKGGVNFVKAVKDKDTRQEALQFVLKNVVMPSQKTGATLMHTESIGDNILFAEIFNPGGSYLTKQENGGTKHLELEEGYYIFSGTEWVYVVYSFATPTDTSPQPDTAELKQRVKDIYSLCQFLR